MTAVVPSALGTPALGTPALGTPATGNGAGLDALFAPRGIAVVGASADPAKLGAAMVRSLSGFGGPVAPVNPRDRAMFDSVAAAAACNGPIDLAVLCVPAAASARALADAAAGGARAALVCAGGFAEAGPGGERLQAQLARVSARTGIRVLGPNTSGFLAPARGLTASFVPAAAQVPPGRVGVVAASGGVNHAVAFLLADGGHGVSLAVGLGNALDVTTADVLDHLAEDPGTAAVALHVESVADGPRLLAGVARLAVRKPVVALVVGRQDVSDFARSHTGALATSWRITCAALRQAGAVLVRSERELVDAVGALSLVRLPRPARGVGVLTAQAGPGLLLLDDLRGRGAAIPELTAGTQAAVAEQLPPMTFRRNPVDTGRPGPGFGAVLAAIAGDPGVDVVAAYTLHEPGAFDLVAELERAEPAVPVVLAVGGTGPEPASLRKALIGKGIPAPADPSGVAAAVGALLADAAARPASPARTGREGVEAARLARARPGPGPWHEADAKDVIAELGVPSPPRRVCADRSAAYRALDEVGVPVAVKLLDAAVLHKTEIGGVQLGVRTRIELDAALDALAAAGAREVLIERMARPGIDLIVGARRDPVFGPIVLLGLGGTVAEALNDVAVRVAPLTPAAAGVMVDDLAGRALLDGWRGGPCADRGELGRFVSALGDLLVAHPRLSEVEVNPLRVTPQGLLALDAVIIADQEESDVHPDS